jgi:rod shape-determining protein MreB
VAYDFAIDLGTANTLVYARGDGIVFNEPSVIALDTQSRRVLAMGSEAQLMIGRTPPHIVAHRPLRSGAIRDFAITEEMVRILMAKVMGRRFRRSRALVCVPSVITPVEQRAVLQACRNAGIHSTYLIEQPVAAAVGAGLPIHAPVGSMVVDIGGGTTEVALLSLGGVVSLQAARVGSFDIDAAIQQWVRRRHRLVIGESAAEHLKEVMASAHPDTDRVDAHVRGRLIDSGLPGEVLLKAEEIRLAIEDIVSTMITTVVACVAEAPPDLGQDLLELGASMVGGGSLLAGLSTRIEERVQFPVKVVDTPLESVVRGAGQCLENFGELQGLFVAG